MGQNMKRKTTKEFIEEAKKIHADKYDYSLVEYKNTNTPVKIICKIHGEFIQEPKIHLWGCNCPKCAREKETKNQFLSTDEFKQKAIKVHGTKYEYSKVQYSSANKKVPIICKEHGVFFQAPVMHLYGQGCPTCGKNISGVRLTQDEFIGRLQKRYGNKFDYTKVKYINGKTPVIVTCKQHGDFEKRAEYLLDEHIACPDCVLISRKDKTNRPGGYNLTIVNRTPNKKAQFYVLKLHDKNETFYKVGITIQKIKYRFPKMNVAGYKVEICLVEYLSLKEAYTKEQKTLEKNNKWYYLPNRKFNGYTECLSKYPLLREAPNLD